MPTYEIRVPVTIRSTTAKKELRAHMLLRIEADSPIKALGLLRKGLLRIATQPPSEARYDAMLEALGALERATPTELARHLGVKTTRTIWGLLQGATKRRHVRRHEVRGAHSQYSLSKLGVRYLGAQE